MLVMSVTLDVSKLSGWLNDDASCRVEKRACDAGRGGSQEAGGRGEVAAQAACKGRGRLKAGGPGHTRSARYIYDVGRGPEREARGRGGGSGASGARGDGPT
eukprot:scaffold10289_cov47-Phaeocystis_antarctica.AAC.3